MSPRQRLIAALALALCLAPAGLRAASVNMPGGVDYMRLAALEKELANAKDESQATRMAENQKMAVYLDLLGIGKDTESQLLFTGQKTLSEDSPDKVRDRFINKIVSTGRFRAYDARNSQSGVEDQTSIYVHGRILSRHQDILDRLGVRKAVTVVTLGLQIKDSRDGKILKTATVNGVYGDGAGEGELIPRDKKLNDPVVQANLRNSYLKALDWALELAAAEIERTYRPMGIVLASGKEGVTLYGGLAHGIQPKDRFVVFRSQPIPGVVRRDLGQKIPLAVIECMPDQTSSTCTIVDKGSGTALQLNDPAVLTDQSLKLKGDE